MAKEELTAKQKQKQETEKRKGVTDEVEIMKMLILENRGLYNRVLDKIRQYRASREGDSFENVGKNKKDSGPQKKEKK